jgi:hypothetical protein
MRDIILILLGIAIVPLAQFIWAVFKHITIIINAFWTKRRKRTRLLWDGLVMGTKHSLGGFIVALIIVGLLGWWISNDSQKAELNDALRQQRLIETMNKNTQDIINVLQNNQNALIDAIQQGGINDNTTTTK